MSTRDWYWLEQKHEELVEDLFFDWEYEPHLLVAISQTKALQFCNGDGTDPSYPPVTEKPAHNQPSSQRYSVPDGIGRNRVQPKPARRGSMHPLPHSTTSRPLTRRTINLHQNSPVPDENIRSLPYFCFPENAKIYQEHQEERVHYLVLTDVNGVKTYAVCLTFYKEYAINMSAGLGSCLIPHGHPNTTGQPWTKGFLPTCYVLISKHPYFTVLKECLSYILHDITTDPDMEYDIVKERAFQLIMTPVPPAGNVCISFSLEKRALTIWPPDYPDKPVVDFPLHLLFQCFSLDQILTVIAYILVEERIVFISSDYSLLTYIMESFQHFILPFKWRYSYVPLLSSRSLEFLEAPGTFMMGCHSQFRHEVEQIDGLVMVDIDQGRVTVNQTIDNDVEREAMLNLPKIASDPFRNACERIKFTFDLMEFSRPSYCDIREYQRFREKKIREFNREIIFNALALMVSLFRGVITEMRVDLKKFNKDHFLQIQSSADRPFYERVIKTDMFKKFVQERLNEKRDYWSELEIATRMYGRPGQRSRTSMSTGPRPIKRASTPAILTPHITVEFVRFFLPTLTEFGAYLQMCLHQLNRTVHECRDVIQRAPYLYLRAMFRVLDGRPVDAIDDCFQLISSTARIFPKELVMGLYSNLSKPQLEQLQKRPYFRMTDVFSDELKPEPAARDWRDIGESQLPSKDVDKDKFAECIVSMEIALDYDIIQRLFESLTLFGVKLCVDPVTFEVFHDCWQENKSQTQGIKVQDGKLDHEESVLKVSPLIKTDFGNGRIALTCKRLFFLKDVSNNYQEIIKLREIEQIEKVQMPTFLLSDVDALRIYGKDNSTFVACLKDERNCWFMLLSEMWSGKQYADGTLDFGAIQQAAQNVLLIDAVIRSGQEDDTCHHLDVGKAATNLCFFTLCREEGRHRLPKVTMETLQHCVDPNMREKEKKTVESLLYIPGNHCSEDGRPKLWCGLGNGVIKVYDAGTLQLDTSFTEARTRVVCLLAVGDSQVWAGSFCIYIIDMGSVTCDKTLMEHHDLVSDMVLTEDNSYVYSCSVNGEICKWETETLRLVQNIELPKVASLVSIHLQNDTLWCCTKRDICQLADDGTIMKKLTYSDKTGHPIILDCFLIQPTGEIMAGCSRKGQVLVWDPDSENIIQTFDFEDCRGISKMVQVDNKVWVATKNGTIVIVNTDTNKVDKTLQGHEDAVRSMCCAQSRYVITGAGSRDGKIAIWRASESEKPVSPSTESESPLSETLSSLGQSPEENGNMADMMPQVEEEAC
ncbi:DENN domain-containing protein 3-like isoform X2 [Liolophura sinensis]|uniref:DENN domain-containing protein 3-like isoform X2 n=1 Tax=Liolophura sinensis TaxID=3198878 RepID=UPI0031580A33